MAKFFENADPEHMEFKPLPVKTEEGAPYKNIYLVEAHAVYKVSNKGNDMVEVNFEVQEPAEFAGRRVKDYLSFGDVAYKNTQFTPNDSTMKRLTQLFGDEETDPTNFVGDLEGDLLDDIIPAIVAKLDGLVMAIRINQKESEYQGEKRTQNNVTAYHQMDAFGDDDDDE